MRQCETSIGKIGSRLTQVDGRLLKLPFGAPAVARKEILRLGDALVDVAELAGLEIASPSLSSAWVPSLRTGA